MTETPTPPPPPPPPSAPSGDDDGPRTSAEEVRDLGRIRRSSTDRKVAGVAGGLARHLDVDPVILRVAFVVLTFFGGAGLIAYAAGWLLLPTDDGSEGVIAMEDRNRAVVLTIVAIVAGLAIVAELAGDAWGPFWFPWQLAAVAVIVAVLVNRRERRRSAPVAPPAQPDAQPYAQQYGQPYGQSVQGWVGDPPQPPSASPPAWVA
ncbi:PspC domain-containing protein, partial [Nocardioides marinus]